MDTIKNMMGSSKSEQPAAGQTNTESSSGGGGWANKFNSMAGGGRESEKNEDALDKGTYIRSTLRNQRCADNKTGVDFVQEKILGQGPQDNESAFEQAKDERISDCKLPVCSGASFVRSFVRH